MSWMGDFRPGSGSSAGQAGLGDSSQSLFDAHPIRFPITLIVVGLVLFGFGHVTGGVAEFAGAIGVIIVMCGLVALPFGVRKASRRNRG